MALGGCYACIKYVMFAFNFVFWLLGCAILGVGIWARVDKNLEEYLAKDDAYFSHIYTGAYVLIAVGVVIMIIGFLGCCGAIRESQCLLSLFFICLFIIFAVLLGAGIWALIFKDNMREHVYAYLKQRVDDYGNADGVSKRTMDKIQLNLDCCGADGFTDYVVSGNVKPVCKALTETKLNCCGSDKGLEDYKPLNITDPASCIGYEAKGCTDALFEFLKKHLVIVAGVAIGIGVILLLGLIFSMCLCCAIRRTNRHKYP